MIDPVLQDLRLRLIGLRDSGLQAVTVTGLIEYLDGAVATNMTPEMRMELWKEVCQRERVAFDARVRNDLEMFKSVIAAGRAALQAAILINGGAAVAVLSYCGSLLRPSGTTAPHASMSDGLFVFVLGVLAAAMASGATYVSQADFARQIRSRGEVLRLLGIGLVSASYACFLLGAYFCHRAL